MGSLVDDLLLLARLDQGRPLESASRRPRRARRRRRQRRPRGRPDRVITAEVAEGVTVDGDEHRLRQVVANLVGNALVHTPPGTPVAVRVHNGGEQAVVEVHDDGPGMDPEVARRAPSSASPAPIRRALVTPAAPGSVSRSCRRSSTPTAVRCRSRPDRAGHDRAGGAAARRSRQRWGYGAGVDGGAVTGSAALVSV